MIWSTLYNYSIETVIFQVLISEAGVHKADNNSKEEHKKLSASREKEKPTVSESHVEMDSRLLTALLTVSINNSWLLYNGVYLFSLSTFLLSILTFRWNIWVSFYKFFNLMMNFISFHHVFLFPENCTVKPNLLFLCSCCFPGILLRPLINFVCHVLVKSENITWCRV